MVSVAQIIRLVQGVPSKDKYTSPAISGIPESSDFAPGIKLLLGEIPFPSSAGGRRDELVVVPAAQAIEEGDYIGSVEHHPRCRKRE